jgi:hypothetical protein
VILANLDSDYEEGMQYGMISYYVPHRVFPPGYHCAPDQPLPFAGLASQKNHMAVYLMGVYVDGEDSESLWFRKAWAKTGKKLDMGKCCVRFKQLEGVALDVVGESIRRLPAKKYIGYYAQSLAAAGKGLDGKKLQRAGAARTATAKHQVTASKPAGKSAKKTAKK